MSAKDLARLLNSILEEQRIGRMRNGFNGTMASQNCQSIALSGWLELREKMLLGEGDARMTKIATIPSEIECVGGWVFGRMNESELRLLKMNLA